MTAARDDTPLLAALAPLALAADIEAKAARPIAAIRTDPLERAIFLDRAARWQRLYDGAAAAIEALAPPDRHPPARREIPVYAENP